VAGDCCSAGANCEAFQCCLPIGASMCSAATDCCSSDASCESGECCLALKTGTCSAATDCCSSDASCESGECCLALRTGTCNLASDCCLSNAFCSVGQCCLPAGQGPCSAASECCDAGALCQGGGCCRPFGEACTANTQCCSGPCLGLVCVCFPGTSTVQRLHPDLLTPTSLYSESGGGALLKGSPDGAMSTWDSVSLRGLRVGDTIQCVIPPVPQWLGKPQEQGASQSAPSGTMSTCKVYDWKAVESDMMVVALTYLQADGSKGVLKVRVCYIRYISAKNLPNSILLGLLLCGLMKDSGLAST
jgi:hypothetical protein